MISDFKLCIIILSIKHLFLFDGLFIKYFYALMHQIEAISFEINILMRLKKISIL